MVAPDLRHPRRSQAEIPLIDLSEFGQPPLASQSSVEFLLKSGLLKIVSHLSSSKAGSTLFSLTAY
jgi:hypothetical protein